MPAFARRRPLRPANFHSRNPAPRSGTTDRSGNCGVPRRRGSLRIRDLPPPSAPSSCSPVMSGMGDTATDSSTSDDTCYHSEGLVRSDFDSSEEARCNAGAGGGGRRRRATTVFFCRLSIVLFSRNGLTPRRSPPPSSASGTRASPVRRVVQPSDWELAARLPVRPFET